MKKIAFVIEFLGGGGAERVTAALANELCRQTNYEVHMIVYRRNAQKDYSTDTRIVWHEVSCTGGSRIGRITRRVSLIRKIMKKVKPDCVVSLGTQRIITPLTLALAGLGVPLILSERNDPKQFPVRKSHRLLRFLCYTFCDALVFQTEQARSYFPVFMQKKSRVIGNPIISQLPARYGDVREHRIVNFCRLVPQKNLSLLIDAFSDIADIFPDYTLDIYGEGPEQGNLEEKIKGIGLEKRVNLCGHSAHIYEDIYRAALFVSSSDYEGISNSMLEALALGVPTVCTDCPAGGAGETIRNGENGLLVPVADRAALAGAMTQVLKDEALAEKMSLAGTQLRQTLCVSKIAKEWLTVIDRVIAG